MPYNKKPIPIILDESGKKKKIDKSLRNISVEPEINRARNIGRAGVGLSLGLILCAAAFYNPVLAVAAIVVFFTAIIGSAAMVDAANRKLDRQRQQDFDERQRQSEAKQRELDMTKDKATLEVSPHKGKENAILEISQDNRQNGLRKTNTAVVMAGEQRSAKRNSKMISKPVVISSSRSNSKNNQVVMGR